MSTSLLCGAILALSGQTAVDRSGEAALKSVLESMGQVRGARILVSQSSRESATQEFYAGNDVDLTWDGPNQFRVVISNMWGDGSIFIGDGDTYAKNPLDLSQPFTLKTLGDSATASVTELALKGDRQLVTLYLLDGEKSLEKLAPKTAAVRVLESGNQVEINPSPFGKLVIRWQEVKGKKLVDRLEFDDWDSKVEFHKKFPDWVDMPTAGTLDVESIRYMAMNKKFDKKLFDTKPPKGVTTADERKKKPL